MCAPVLESNVPLLFKLISAVQAKVLRTLQYFPLPEGTQAQRQLHDTLVAIFNRE